jgi:hypothetical protein
MFTGTCNVRCASILGGACSKICNTSSIAAIGCSTIGGGMLNVIVDSNLSTIAGGFRNTVSSSYSIVSGGRFNTVSSVCSGSLGSCNIVCCVNSYAVGNGITTVSCNTTHVVCLNITSIPTEAALPLPSGTVYRCTTDCTLRIVP